MALCRMSFIKLTPFTCIRSRGGSASSNMAVTSTYQSRGPTCSMRRLCIYVCLCSPLPPSMFVSPCLSVLFYPCFLLRAFPLLSHLSSSLLSLFTCSSSPHQLVCVYKPLFPTYSLSVCCVFDSPLCILCLLPCLLLPDGMFWILIYYFCSLI